MARKRQEQQRTGGDSARTSSEGLRYAIAVQLEAVMGEIQKRSDVVLVGNYEKDRAACQAAIDKALAELNAVEASGDEKSDEFDLAWAWHRLDEAYVRLSRVVSRAHLARRRTEVDAQRWEKARLRAKKEAEHA